MFSEIQSFRLGLLAHARRPSVASSTFNSTKVTRPHQAMVASTPSACTPSWAPIDDILVNPAPPSAVAANTPVSSVPTTPPTPCTGHTSSESSRCSTRLPSCVA
jgi:hypothetical protein